MKEENRLLNVLKGIACLLVVFIHVPFPGVFGRNIAKIGDVAVQFFFLISGWYAYCGNKERFENKILSKINHIWNLCYKAVGFYLILTVLIHIYQRTIFSWILSLCDLKYWFKIIAMNNFSFLDLGGETWLVEVLWFLPALLYCYLILILLVKLKLDKYAWIAIPILFLGRFLVIEFMPNINWHYYNNFLLTGMPYVLMGYCLSCNKERILNKKIVKINLAAVVMGGIIYLYSNETWEYIGIIAMAVSLIVVAQMYPHFYVLGLEYIGKKMSFKIYVGHVFWIWLIDKMVDYTNISINSIYQYCKPILVVILTMGSILLYENLKKFYKKAFIL